MAVDFPNSPSNGDTTTINGVVYTYNSTKTAWETLESVDANAALSDNPPTNPNNGDLWFNSASGELLVRYNDGTSSQWVGVSGPAGPSVSLSAIGEDILPDADSSRSLGSPTKKWKDLYLSGSTIHLGDSATLSAAPGGEIVLPSLKIGTGSNAVKLEANSSGGLETRAVVGGTTQAAKPASGTTQVATLAAMQAIVNPSIGDLCSVTANNTIYMYNGTGFYKIATMVNESPSAITGVDGSYALALDGTATTITANSSDPEGRILDWSYAVSSGSLTNGGGTTATITQGTGVNTHVFTITPTTNSAYQGSFSITFNVTDNVNGAVSAVSAFTLSFVVTNSRYTALSVKATNTGSNQTFDDASTSNHTITTTGDVTASTFSPHRHGGYSTYLGTTSSSSYYTNSSSDFDIGGTGNWSYEAWIYADNQTFASYPRAFGLGPYYSNTKSFGVFLKDSSNSNYITAYWDDASGIGRKLISTTSFSQDVWHHILVCRSGNDIALYLDGTRIAHNNSYTSSIDSGDTYLFVGTGSGNNGGFMGHARDVRFINGSHPYDASASSITVPTEPLGATTNTKFLLGDLPYFKDQSTSNHAITFNGDVSSKPKSLFDNSEYSEASHGASVYFDGTGDYISAANHADFNVGSSDFTLECWAYIEDATADAAICGLYNFATNQRSYMIYLTSSTANLGVVMSSDGTYQSGSGFDSGVAVSNYLNQWVHLALTKSGTNATLYLNGNSIGTTSSAPSTLHASTAAFVAGKFDGATVHTTGYISDVRLVNGSVVYSSNFTPPAAPLTAITNTKFLLNPETSISDLSQSSEITCVGDAATSTTQVKFAGTKSIYLDGTGDYLQISNLENSWISGYTGDFTIEFWWYPTNVSNGTVQYILTAGNGFQLYISNGGALNLALDDNNATSFFWHPQSIHTMVNDTWQHLAVVRNGNVYTVYVDGVSKATTTSNDLIGTGTDPVQLGIYGGNSLPAQGYFQDLRITKGLARYTANFTPPTAELQG